MSKQQQEAAIVECQKALKDIGVPCFLYFMTISDDNDEILTVSYKQGNDENIANLTPLPSYNDDGVANTIQDQIQEELKKLYDDKVKAAAAAGVPADPNDEIIAKLTAAGITTASTARTVGNIQVKMADGSNVADDVLITDLIKNEGNVYDTTDIQNLKDFQPNLAVGGSSRSMKNRRRHKQKKNKNTKRRNRK